MSVTLNERKQNDEKGGEGAVTRRYDGLPAVLCCPCRSIVKTELPSPFCVPYRKADTTSSPRSTRDLRPALPRDLR